MNAPGHPVRVLVTDGGSMTWRWSVPSWRPPASSSSRRSAGPRGGHGCGASQRRPATARPVRADHGRRAAGRARDRDGLTLRDRRRQRRPRRGTGAAGLGLQRHRPRRRRGRHPCLGARAVGRPRCALARSQRPDGWVGLPGGSSHPPRGGPDPGGPGPRRDRPTDRVAPGPLLRGSSWAPTPTSPPRDGRTGSAGWRSRSCSGGRMFSRCTCP